MNIWLRAQKMFFCEFILISHHPENPNFKTVQKVAGIMGRVNFNPSLTFPLPDDSLALCYNISKEDGEYMLWH